MINYIRNEKTWYGTLSIDVGTHTQMKNWHNEALKDNLEKLDKIQEKVVKQFNEAIRQAEAGKIVDIEAVATDVRNLLVTEGVISLPNLIEDAEITLLSKGIEGTPNVMTLVGYMVCKIEEELRDKTDHITALFMVHLSRLEIAIHGPSTDE